MTGRASRSWLPRAKSQCRYNAQLSSFGFDLFLGSTSFFLSFSIFSFHSHSLLLAREISPIREKSRFVVIDTFSPTRLRRILSIILDLLDLTRQKYSKRRIKLRRDRKVVRIDAKEHLVSCFHPTSLEYQYSSRGGRIGWKQILVRTPIDGKLSLTLGQHRPTSISRSPGRWNSNKNLIETTTARFSLIPTLIILFQFYTSFLFFLRKTIYRILWIINLTITL